MENKKSNKKVLIVVGIIIIIVIAIVLIIMSMKSSNNNNEENNNTENVSKFNEIVNRSEHTYGNTDYHNASYGAIVTDDEYWYYAGTGGIKKQAKADILQFNTNKEIFSASSLYLNLYNDYLYFLNQENNTIYKIDKDGNKRQEIANNIKSFYIVDDCIYYNKYEGEYMGGIYRMDVNGENEETVVNRSVKKFVPYGNLLYYIAGSKVLARTDLNGNNEEIILGDVNNFKILDNVIFYEDVVDNNNVYMLLSDKTTQRLSGTSYYDSEITVDSILCDDKYICILPTDTSTTVTVYNMKYRPAFFQSKETQDIYFELGKLGKNTKDYEIIGEMICCVDSSGYARYVNIQGSDFKNIKELEN